MSKYCSYMTTTWEKLLADSEPVRACAVFADDVAAPVEATVAAFSTRHAHCAMSSAATQRRAWAVSLTLTLLQLAPTPCPWWVTHAPCRTPRVDCGLVVAETRWVLEVDQTSGVAGRLAPFPFPLVVGLLLQPHLGSVVARQLHHRPYVASSVNDILNYIIAYL